MDTDISDVYISDYLQSKLTNVRQSHEDLFTSYIIGWQEEGRLSCVDCASDSVHFPEGLDVVGVLCCLSSTLENEHLETVFDKYQLISVCEKFPTVRVILFVFGSDDSPGKAKIKAMLCAEHASSLLEPVPCIYQTDDCLTGMLFRARGYLPLLIELASDNGVFKENVAATFERSKNMFMSGIPAFHLKDTHILLHSSYKEHMECKKLLDCIADEEINKKKKPKDTKRLRVPLNFEILMQCTGDPAIENSVDHSLVIHCQRRDFICISLKLPIDVIVFTPENSKTSVLYNNFVNAVVKQLVEMENCAFGFFGLEMPQSSFPQPYHFFHHNWDFPKTVVYPSDKADDDLEPYRRELHEHLLLPVGKPLLRKKNQHLFPNEELVTTGYLKNPHTGLPPSGVEDGETALVYGVYSYHHYMQDHINDDGWGCAYRSLQTIVSWFRHQGYTDAPVPTHREIQQALVDVGDKPASFVGSRKWIGSQEVGFCLDKLIGVTCKTMFVSCGADLANKGRELVKHFHTQGTPIMIGGGVLAHTIIGVDFSQHTGDLKFLILDPHYTGSEDLHIIQSKGWCGWKSMQFWDQTAFYNLCLPQCPEAV